MNDTHTGAETSPVPARQKVWSVGKAAGGPNDGSGSGGQIFENLSKNCLCEKRFATEKFALVQRKICSRPKVVVESGEFLEPSTRLIPDGRKFRRPPGGSQSTQR